MSRQSKKLSQRISRLNLEPSDQKVNTDLYSPVKSDAHEILSFLDDKKSKAIPVTTRVHDSSGLRIVLLLSFIFFGLAAIFIYLLH